MRARLEDTDVAQNPMDDFAEGIWVKTCLNHKPNMKEGRLTQKGKARQSSQAVDQSLVP